MVNFFYKRILLAGKLIGEAFGILLLLPVRMRMKLDHRRQNRIALKRVERFATPDLDSKANLWDPYATLPGNPNLLPWKQPEVWIKKESKRAFDDIMDHKFFVLSDAPHDINLKQDCSNRVEKIKNLAKEVRPEKLKSYSPIDWHKDFKSGYRWSETEFYLNVRVASAAGADIKTPRELSRFQHIGAMAKGPTEEASEEFVLQVLDWIVANPYGYGVNWACTMDVGLRAINWIWGMRFFQPYIEKRPSIYKTITVSLYQHAIHIEHNLEYYKGCTGNHYLSNIVGLLYIGCAFPEFEEANRWVVFCIQELISEMKREVHSDGSAHEASTHYHRLVAELFISGASLCERITESRKMELKKIDVSRHKVIPKLKLSSVRRIETGERATILPTSFYSQLAKMSFFTESLTKPNMLVPQFGDNDSARVHKLYPINNDKISDHRHIIACMDILLNRPADRYPKEIYLEASLVCGNLPQVIIPRELSECDQDHILFPDAGIAIVRNESAYLAVTCGANGQLGRGGHGHNDKLSFELNVFGLDFISDGGCPVYTANPKTRNEFRGTSAHSTIYIEGQEQDSWTNSIDGLFVLRERSFPKLALTKNEIWGSHFGFDTPHKRAFVLLNNSLLITDEFKSDSSKRIVFNLHPNIHPDIVNQKGKVRVKLIHNTGKFIEMILTGTSDPIVEDGYYSDGYGVRCPTQKLSMAVDKYNVETIINWE